MKFTCEDCIEFRKYTNEDFWCNILNKKVSSADASCENFESVDL